MSIQTELDERQAEPALEQIERALAEVHRLCQPGTRWHMTIPVDVDDSDVVIAGALVAARKALREKFIAIALGSAPHKGDTP